MGRRPNAVVSQYFERGEKLKDHSNRYAHTCKRCGEFFPKGRIDNLMSHILRRCANVTQEDRQIVFRAMNQSHLEPPRPLDTSSHMHMQSFPDLEQVVNVQYEVPTSFLQREQSALDTLAEVSRQHHQYHFDANQPHPAYLNAEQDLDEQDLLTQLRAACAEDSTRPDSTNDQEPAQLHAVHTSSPLPLEQTATNIMGASTLSHTASAANDELQRATKSTSPLDPQLEQAASTPNATHPDPAPKGNDNESTCNPANAASVKAFATGMSVMTPFNEADPGSGMIQRPAKSKIRNRFTDTRRKEVQEIRKRGACLRCRMLKKPCSEGNPCSTCKGVESARLWKGACVRTRLADEFTLWSTGLFHAKAAINVASAVHGSNQSPNSGRVEVKLFSNCDACITLAARAHRVGLRRNQVIAIEGAGSTNSLKRKSDDVTEIVVLEDSTGAKIDAYIGQALDGCVAADKSPFLKATLQQARDMKLDTSAPSDTTASRSSYNLQDDLVQNVVELWVATAILAYLRLERIEFKYYPANTPQTATSLPEQSRELIFSQILSAVETRCSAKSKIVLNELERRLLQRQQVSRFATFIASILLINCIERMTGLYRSFDPEPNPSETNQRKPSDWPLDDPPRKLWLQGEKFASLLIMLLRMRALPPRTSITAKGLLVVDQSQTLPMSINGRTAKEQTDDQTTIPAAWLDPIQLREADIQATRDDGLPDTEKGAAGWDLKFISRLLLPEPEKRNG